MTPNRPRLSDSATRRLKAAQAAANEMARATETAERTRAATEMQRRAHAIGDEPHRQQRQKRNAFLQALVGRAKTVMSSYALTAPVVVTTTPQRGLSAYTDFTSINVNYPLNWLPEYDAAQGCYVTNSENGQVATLHQTAADVLGVLYHEVGHLRHTVHPERLVQMARADEYIRLNSENLRLELCNRLTPNAHLMSCSNDCSGVHQILSDDPGAWASVSTNAIKDATFQGLNLRTDRFHEIWNLLEDQRMELAQVNDSAVMATYFTIMAQYHLTNEIGPMAYTSSEGYAAAVYPLVVGRIYLPTEIRRMARDAYVDALAAEIGLDAANKQADALRDTVWDYISATTPTEMVHAMMRMANFDTPRTSASHQARMGTGGGAYEENVEKIENSASTPTEQDEEDAPSPSEGDEGDEGDEGAEQGSEQNGPEGAEQGDSDGAAGASADSGDEQAAEQGKQSADGSGGKAFRKAFEDALKDVVEDLQNGMVFQAQVDSLVDQMVDQTGASDVPECFDGTPMTSQQVSEARQLVDQMARAFEPYLARTAPSWMHRESHGVLNPLQYRTRQPGDRDFYRRWDGRDGEGVDAAVTLILDVSGSMDGYLPALGQAALATGMTCERLGIPFKCYIFGSDSQLFAQTGSLSQMVPPILGSTNPSKALEWTRDEPVESSNHLVLVMTDGQFDSGVDARKSMERYVPENGRMLGVGFSYSETAAAAVATTLESYGCPAAVGVTDLQEIPKAVTDFILSTTL